MSSAGQCQKMGFCVSFLRSRRKKRGFNSTRCANCYGRNRGQIQYNLRLACIFVFTLKTKRNGISRGAYHAKRCVVTCPPRLDRLRQRVRAHTPTQRAHIDCAHNLEHNHTSAGVYAAGPRLACKHSTHSTY